MSNRRAMVCGTRPTCEAGKFCEAVDERRGRIKVPVGAEGQSRGLTKSLDAAERGIVK